MTGRAKTVGQVDRDRGRRRPARVARLEARVRRRAGRGGRARQGREPRRPGLHAEPPRRRGRRRSRSPTSRASRSSSTSGPRGASRARTRRRRCRRPTRSTGQQGLVVLGVDAQDFRQDAKRFVKRFGITYPVVYDGSGSTLGKWGVTGFPETFFVDRDGTARRRADPGRHRHRAQPGGVRRGRPARSRASQAVIRARSRPRSPRWRSSARRCGRTPGAGRSRGGDRLPDLQDDARPVELADRDTDEGVHPGADRRR